MTSAERLMEKGIRPSLTRVMIYDYLLSHRTHPTVDEIYKELAPKAPTLSKTTVYNTVKLLSQEGVIKMLTIEEQQARFDAFTGHHGHFLCNNCKKVHDFDVDVPTDKLPEGFTAQTKEIFYTGICCDCAE